MCLMNSINVELRALGARAGLLATFILAALPAFANDIATSGSGSHFQQQSGELLPGRCVIVANLFKRVNEFGELIIVPLAEAQSRGSGCPRLRDYRRIEAAYLRLTTDHNQLPSCLTMTAPPPVGQVCRTAKGGRFKRYQHPTTGALGWQDLESKGLIWFDEVSKEVSQARAKEICQGQSLALPTTFQSLVAYERGIQEIAKDKLDDIYWTTDGNPDESQGTVTTLLEKTTGFSFFNQRSGRPANARCVSRPAAQP